MKKTKLRKISKKRQSNFGKEAEVFKKIRETREHRCVVCGKMIRGEPCSFMFAHRLPKGMYPEFKYNPFNIWLVCSIKCHEEFDRINAGRKGEIIKELLNK